MMRPNKFVVIAEIGASSKTDGLVSPDYHQLRMKTDGNERKMSLPFSFSYLLYENGSGSGTAGSGNGSGINGNTKTGKYDRKIDGNER
jgi:hypothetical protein